MTYIRDHAVKPHCTHRGTVDFRFSLLPLPLDIVQHMYCTIRIMNLLSIFCRHRLHPEDVHCEKILLQIRYCAVKVPSVEAI